MESHMSSYSCDVPNPQGIPNAIASGEQKKSLWRLSTRQQKAVLRWRIVSKTPMKIHFFVQQIWQLHENVTSYGGHLDTSFRQTSFLPAMNLCESPGTLPWFSPSQSTLLQEPGRWLDDWPSGGVSVLPVHVSMSDSKRRTFTKEWNNYINNSSMYTTPGYSQSKRQHSVAGKELIVGGPTLIEVIWGVKSNIRQKYLTNS